MNPDQNPSSKILIVMRHGESLWNLENRFTGWKDIELSEKGWIEAKAAGQQLKTEGYQFDLALTSCLKRAIHTLDTVLNEIDQVWLPVQKAWQLNERHYGALTGLNKAETAAKHGDEQVKIWRRSYNVPPPAIDASSPDHPGNDVRYKNVNPKSLPAAESLELTVARVIPYWTETIVPLIQKGNRLLLVAHGNSLRALIKHLEGISDNEIVEMNIPTAVPLRIELDANLKFLNKRYLGNPEEIAKAMAQVASQGKAKKG